MRIVFYRKIHFITNGTRRGCSHRTEYLWKTIKQKFYCTSTRLLLVDLLHCIKSFCFSGETVAIVLIIYFRCVFQARRLVEKPLDLALRVIFGMLKLFFLIFSFKVDCNFSHAKMRVLFLSWSHLVFSQITCFQ